MLKSPGGSPNRVEDLFFEDKSSVEDLPKSKLLEILVINPQLKVGDFRKISTEDLKAVPIELGIYGNPQLGICFKTKGGIYLYILKVLVNLQLKVGDLCKSSTEDFGALPIEVLNPQLAISVNPDLRIYLRKINPQLYWESLLDEVMQHPC